MIEDIFLSRNPLIKRPISFEEYCQVKEIWNDDYESTKLVVTHSFITQTLSYYNLKKTKGSNWLNDEVINAYLKLLSIEFQENLIFNTFFYLEFEKFMKKNSSFEKISRIMKRFGFNSGTKALFIPVNQGNVHWAFIYINLESGELSYCDSLNSSAGYDSNILDSFEELLNLMYKILDCDQRISLKRQEISVPQQENSNDCGVFTVMGIHSLLEGSINHLNQNLIPYFRIKITNDLINGFLR